ncbi:Ca2+ regulator and membrane fusion protein Fig1-domain-containing protein [Aspergillus tetrazonus]
METNSQHKTERSAPGAQTTPLPSQNMHALQAAMHSILPTPSHSLLRKLRFRSEWRPRWPRGGSRIESEQLEGRVTVEENEQGQTEENEGNEDHEEGEEEEEEENNHSSLLNQHRSRSGSPRTLLVAGCSSNRMRAIYILQLSYQHGHQGPSSDYGPSALNPFYAMVSNLSSAGDLIVRVGYFGVCAATKSLDNTTDWTCRSKAGDLGAQISTIRDPLNVLVMADNFRDEIILSVIIIMSIVLIFLSFSAMATFPGWHTEIDASGDEVEVKPFPSRPVAQLVLSFNALASMVLIVAVLWQHVAVVAHAATAEAAFGGAVKGDVGAVAMGLGWGAIGAVLVVTFGIAIQIPSLKLYVLTDDEED